ncbi:MAG: M12 family metallopeptidase [Candidatus Aphodosoma sp.]
MKKAMTECANADNNVIKFVEIKDNGWNRFAWGIGCDYHICLNKATDKNIAGSSTMCCVPWATISMSKNETFGSYLHELGHTLGPVHEQCRPDRDNSVTIHYENIMDGYKSNFHKYLKSSVTVYGDFDFESIMMYPTNAFSKNGQPTITKGQNGTYSTQRVKLSDSDKKHIKNMYY